MHVCFWIEFVLWNSQRDLWKVKSCSTICWYLSSSSLKSLDLGVLTPSPFQIENFHIGLSLILSFQLIWNWSIYTLHLLIEVYRLYIYSSPNWSIKFILLLLYLSQNKSVVLILCCLLWFFWGGEREVIVLIRVQVIFVFVCLRLI